MNTFIKNIVDYLLSLICKGLNCNKELYKIKQSIQISSTKLTLKGDNKMIVQFQTDQHAVWSIQFLNDDGVPVNVPLFTLESLNSAIVAERLPDGENFLFNVKISSATEAVGEVRATGKTASGIDIPISIAVTTIPDEAERATSTVVINEN